MAACGNVQFDSVVAEGEPLNYGPVDNNRYNETTVTNDAPNEFRPIDDDEAFQESNCFTVLRSSKRVEIPCTRNELRRYKVRVPREVQETIPRKVAYTGYELREKMIPHTVKRFQTAYRDEEQSYTVQVPKKITKMVKVTKKVPKTVYVDVITEEPQEQTIMVNESHVRHIKVPYKKEVFEKQYRTVQERIPVTKYRTEYDNVSKTIYEDTWRTKCVPVTKMVHREIPVYRVVPKSTSECGNCDQIDEFPMYSTNNDGSYATRADNDGQLHTEKYPVVTYTSPAQYDYSNNGVWNNYEAQDAVTLGNLWPTNDTGYIEQDLKLEDVPQTVNYPDAEGVAPVAQEDPKLDRYVQTLYSAPARYDANNDGLLDKKEREQAYKDGNLHVESITEVQNPKGGNAVQRFQTATQPKKSKNKTSKRRRRRRK